MTGLLRQAVRFGAVGFLNTAIGLSAIWLAMALGFQPLQANAMGYALGLVISFTLNRAWTFRDEQVGEARSIGSTLPRYAVAFAIAWTLNIVIVWIGLRFTGYSPYLLQFFGVATYTATFFILCRIWVFSGRDQR